MSRTAYGIICLVLAAAIAGPAIAEVYTVKLNNGLSINSRYRPHEAAWDKGQVMLLTEFGNWITLKKANIENVLVDTESKGYGTVIDTNTISLGWAPNDLDEAGAEQESSDPTTRLLNYLQTSEQPAENYSVEQFVEPGAASGIPLSMVGNSSGFGGN